MIPLSGTMNFGGVPNVQSGDFGFGQSYQNMLKAASQSYSDVMGNYASVIGNQERRAQQILGMYGQLGTQVQGMLGGAENAQLQRIQDQYAQAAGQGQQSMVDRGLGNTTVADSVQRGALYDRSKSEVDLASQMAQMRAGYQSQIGLAGLGYADIANQQTRGLEQGAIGFMGSFPMQAQQGLASLYGQGLQGAEFTRQQAQQNQQFQQQQQLQRELSPFGQHQLFGSQRSGGMPQTGVGGGGGWGIGG